jgi:hypothetical protein
LIKTGEKQSQLIFFDNAGVQRGVFRHPNPDSFITPLWKKDGACFVFAMDRPGLKEDDPDYNPEEFTAFAVVSYPSLEMKCFPLDKSFSIFSFSEFDNHVYVSNSLSENTQALRVDAYDLSGHRIYTKTDMHGTNFSAKGHYYLPSLNEGGEPFGIFDSSTNKSICSFPNEEMETKGIDQYDEWNPQDDDLLLIEHIDGNSTSAYMDVYSISQKKSILRLRDKVYGWTADGKGLLVFQNAQFKIIPISQLQNLQQRPKGPS